MRVAIVGLGVTGAATLMKLSESFDWGPDDQIDIYEPRERLGAGFPYAQDDESIVINTYPDSLSVIEGDREDFIEWLKVHHPQDDYYNNFVSRTYYGEYLNERIQPYLDLDYVKVIPEKVVNMRVLDGQTGEVLVHREKNELNYQLLTANTDWSEVYDAVFFAIGHPPYRDAYQLKGEANYFHNPYPLNQQLSKPSNNQHVGIIGSGLTTVDLLRFITRHYELENPLTIYVRHEPFASVIQPRFTGEVTFDFSPKWRDQQRALHGGIIPLDVVYEQVKADLVANDIDFEAVFQRYGTGSVSEIRHEVQMEDDNYIRFQGYLAAIYSHLEELVNDLSASDRKRFFTDKFKMVIHFYSQAPHESFEHIISMLEEGSLRIVSGLKDIQATDDGFDIQAYGGVHHADVLINATGFESKLVQSKEQNELIHNLYESNLIIPDEIGELMVTWPQTQPINRPFGTLDHVYLLGMWIFKTQLLNGSASANMRQARKAVAFFKERFEA